MALISKAFVEAGAHVIAPSDMMDGRIKAIKDMLKEMDALNKVIEIDFIIQIIYYN